MKEYCASPQHEQEEHIDKDAHLTDGQRFRAATSKESVRPTRRQLLLLDWIKAVLGDSSELKVRDLTTVLSSGKVLCR